MQWFRHYHGLCTDPKLHRVALEARVRRSVAIAGWCAVLESASDGELRGTCSLDGTDLGLRIGESAAIGDRLLAAFRDRKMLDATGFVCAWMKRQRAVDDVAKRVAKHRQAKSLNGQDTDPGGNVTPPLRNVTETAGNDQSRAEQNREERESPPTPRKRGGARAIGHVRREPRISPAEESDIARAYLASKGFH